MTPIELIDNNPGKTDAELLAIDAADPSGWTRVETPAFLAWLGANGRTIRIRAWATSIESAYTAAISANPPESFDAQSLTVASGALTSFLGAANPDVYLTLDPGSGQRALLGGLVAYGVLEGEEAGELIARARTRPLVTMGDLAAARAQIEERDARVTLDNRIASLASWILAQPDVPTGDQVKAKWESL